MATRGQATGAKRKLVIGVIGLGIIGGIMAESLRVAGYAVCGYDVAGTACARLKRAGGSPKKSAADVAAAADVVITSLATAKALAQVLGAAAGLPGRKKPRRSA